MKPSAYRSMSLAKQGKTKEKDGNLKRWIDERWKNITPYALGVVSLRNAPECGNSKLNPKGQKSVCRPTVKVNRQTPTLAQEYTKTQIKKAIDLKNKGKRIIWSKL